MDCQLIVPPDRVVQAIINEFDTEGIAWAWHKSNHSIHPFLSWIELSGVPDFLYNLTADDFDEALSMAERLAHKRTRIAAVAEGEQTDCETMCLRMAVLGRTGAVAVTSLLRFDEEYPANVYITQAEPQEPKLAQAFLKRFADTYRLMWTKDEAYFNA